MRLVLLSFMLAVCCYGNAAALTTVCENVTVADIVFLVDGSGSIGPDNFREVRSFLKSFISALDIGPNKVQVGLVQYSENPHKEFLLKDHKDKRALAAAVDRMPYRKGGTNTGKAMDFVLSDYLTKEAGSRVLQRVPQIVMVITDGDSTDDVTAPARKLRARGVLLFAIAVGTSQNDAQLREIANKPSESFLFPIASYQALQQGTADMLKVVCTSMEALEDRFADVFFLVDNGISTAQFNVLKPDMVKLLMSLNIDSSSYRVGLAQYGEDINVEFRLNKFRTKQETIQAVKRFRLRPQPSKPHRYLGRALQYASSQFFSTEAGGRAPEGSRQFLIVVSGKTSDDLSSRVARNINAQGINLIGMTPAVKDSPGAAGTGAGVNVDFDGFQYVYDSAQPSMLKTLITTGELDTLTHECKGAKVADIVFIVDESGSIGNKNFELIRDFLHSMVSGLDVGQNRVRVGLVEYGDRPVPPYLYLDSVNDKAELLQFIKVMPYRGGGTGTGAALTFVRKEIFNPKRGSRKDVQKVAIVLTDGKSQDQIAQPALELRRSGVTVYAIGIGHDNKTELDVMATHPAHTHVFTPRNYAELKPLKQILQKALCTNIIDDATSKPVGNEVCKQIDEADIYFLLDDSDTITANDLYDMKKFIVQFIQNFHIGQQFVRIGLVSYSDSATLQFDLTQHSNVKALEKAVLQMAHEGGTRRNTGGALTSMESHFVNARTSRSHRVQEYLILITNGHPADEVRGPAARLRQQNVNVFAMGVKGLKKSDLLDVTLDPMRAFTTPTFDSLSKMSERVLIAVCSTVCEDVPADVIFLTDSSESIEPEDFVKMKEFMKAIVEKSAIGRDKVRVGVMQYSTNYKLEFDLQTFFSKSEITRAIDGMQQMKEGTLTGKAIREVSQYFEAARGGRPDLKQLLIVITDGKSNDDVKKPSADLRARKVVPWAIGIGSAVKEQLVDISGSLERALMRANFDALKELESVIVKATCVTIDCDNIQRADIVFVVDQSSTIDDVEFRSILNFMEAIVNRSTVGSNMTQFGLILYADDVSSYFQLNSYKSRREVVQALTNVQKGGGGNTYTAKALDFSIAYFQAMHGGRRADQVPQILMVITDGDASDKENLQRESDKVRESGIMVFSVGVEGADKTQLETMAGDPKRVFFVDDFDMLKTLEKNITAEICNYTKTLCKKEIDMVVLLDQSNSIHYTDYVLMRNFTKELVAGFDVSEKFVHVGLAQFSENPSDEFFLNQMYTKADVVRRIEQLRQGGGVETNIGRALTHIKNYFLASRGSRDQVLKVLVLITDGESHDDVEDAALVLRSLGIRAFAIAVGDFYDLELLQIVGTPRRLFGVQDYENLKDIKEKIILEICDTEPPVPSIEDDCTINIGIGFDISRPRAQGETLVSGHPLLQAYLPHILYEMSAFGDLCCVKPQFSPTRPFFAYRLVGETGNILYNTDFSNRNTHDSLEGVMNYKLEQPTYFNAALLNSLNDLMQKSGLAVKIVVIFSDGLDEDAMRLETVVDQLKRSGIDALLIVALEGATRPNELHDLEFGRGLLVKTRLSIGMPGIAGNIHNQIDTIAERECCGVLCKCIGPPGPPGGRGKPAPKGEPGLKGQPGFSGEEGAPGDRGPPGPDGPPGIEGCPGPRGYKGSRGSSGDRGDNGEDGLDGINGEGGSSGQNGTSGPKGSPGNPGTPGMKGDPGLKGQIGQRGDPGPKGKDNNTPGEKGDRGNPGYPGDPGRPGVPGDKGLDGNPGPDGRRGIHGAKGSPAGPGAKGLPGFDGTSGPPGPQGATGVHGPKGFPGLPGPQGRQGKGGFPGKTGRTGPNGRKGELGDPGIKGSPGSEGARGMPGQDGRDGYGPPAPKGAKGDPGFPGYPGQQGSDGDKATKGYPGKKGNDGQPGPSGRSGTPGPPGTDGYDGHPGRKGPPGGRNMTDCELITYIRDNCNCCTGETCPAFPTELVLALDTAEVTQEDFERQKEALVTLLEGLTIAESNCPNGARVAVVAYSISTKIIINFQDYNRKKQLIERVKQIQLIETSHPRRLGSAMLYTVRNLFKKVRSGVMVRKVAVFITNGPSQDSDDIVTAMMEFRARNVFPVVVTLRKAPLVEQSMAVDATQNYIYTLLSPEALNKVHRCAICYDPCRRVEECMFIQYSPRPQDVNVDLVMMMDQGMPSDDLIGARQLMSSLVDDIELTRQPGRANNKARVALVQQSTDQQVSAEIGLGTFQNRQRVKDFILKVSSRSSATSFQSGFLEYALDSVLQRTSLSRQRRALLVVVATPTAYRDQDRLSYFSQKIKCEGVATFVMTVGHQYNRTQVEDLASAPLSEHLIHVSRMDYEDREYAKRFFRTFLSTLNMNKHRYPADSMRQACSRLPARPPGVPEPFPTHDRTPAYQRPDLGPQEEPDASGESDDVFADEQEVRFQAQMAGKVETRRINDVMDPLDQSQGQNPLMGATVNEVNIQLEAPINSFLSEDPCLQAQDPGSCQNYTVMWSYDQRTTQCSRFWFGGCGGNLNRFETLADCERLCVKG